MSIFLSPIHDYRDIQVELFATCVNATKNVAKICRGT